MKTLLAIALLASAASAQNVYPQQASPEMVSTNQQTPPGTVTNVNPLQPTGPVTSTPGSVGTTYCTGAANSAYSSGGYILAMSGAGAPQPSVSTMGPMPWTFQLQAHDLPHGQPAQFILSPYMSLVPFGDGTLCVGTQGLRRAGPIVYSSTGPVIFGRALGHLSKYGYAGLSAGMTTNFQCWYRDPGGAAGFNLTNAVAVTFAP